MKIEFWYIGKTSEAFVQKGEELYLKRLKHYTSLKIHTFPRVKHAQKTAGQVRMEKEAKMVLEKLQHTDFLVLLDENGLEMTSTAFAGWINKQMVANRNRIVFLIGGAYGFADTLRQRASFSLSLSKMTFPHELIRIIFLEQLYRAFTILKNEKYHNP